MAFCLASSTPLTKNGKRARVGSNSCPKCEIELNEDVQCICCSICELNFCLKCTNISPALLDALKEDVSQNFKWTCNGCKQNFPCMTGLASQLKTIEQKTDSRILNMEKKMEHMKDELDSKVKEEVNILREGLIDDVKKDIKQSLQDDVRKELYEIEDQRQRALNLLIFNLPESNSKNSIERKTHDNTKLSELCTLIGVKDLDIKVMFRIGNPKEGVNRPLKLVFNNKKHRKDVLDNASKIRKISHTNQLNRCIIVKDLTIRQRDTNKKRREERRKTSQKDNRPPIDEQAYDEDTICENNNKIRTVATIENIDLEQNSSTELLSSQQSQPLLRTIRHLNTHVDDDLGATLPSIDMDITAIGDETVIGGIFSPVATNSKGDVREGEALNK